MPALKAGINFIRLATPTTDDKRLPKVLQNTSGFVYYVSMTGITGSALADTAQGRRGGASASRATPTCRSASASASRPPSRRRLIGASADGVVVGTAIVNAVANVLGRRRQDDRRPGRSGATLVSGLAPACAPPALLLPDRPRHVLAPSDCSQEDRSHELDHQLRSPEDQLDARPRATCRKISGSRIRRPARWCSTRISRATSS